MSEPILHITSRSAWTVALKKGEYTTDSLAEDGFIHCSKLSQVLRVANLVYSGQTGLVLLVLDPNRLTSELRWDIGTDMATELFPHIYGPINLNAVVNTVDFEPDPDGKFRLPGRLKLAES